MNLTERLTTDLILVDPDDQVTVGGKAVVFLELIAGQIPMRVQPSRITSSEQETLGPVRFGQFSRFSGAGKFLVRRRRSKRVTLPRTTTFRRGGGVPFEQLSGNGWSSAVFGSRFAMIG